jgi:hypothetical protein
LDLGGIAVTPTIGGLSPGLEKVARRARLRLRLVELFGAVPPAEAEAVAGLCLVTSAFAAICRVWLAQRRGSERRWRKVTFAEGKRMADSLDSQHDPKAHLQTGFRN